MKKIFGMMYLTLMIASSFLLSGCGEEQTSTKSTATQIESKSAEESKVEKPTVEKKIPQSDKFVVADKDFSNLQLSEYNKPVYDAYGYWERKENGMATAMPDLQPYDGEHIVYLTFDDGPDSKNTPQILDILRNENVPATFYVVGKMVEANPDVLKRIFNEGHAIGNHSYNHDYDELYSSPWNFISQFQKTDDIIMAQIGVRPLIIRAPGGTYGAFNADYWEMIKSGGYVEHDWNVLTRDAESGGTTAAAQIANVEGQMAANDYNLKSVICLMHSTAAKDATVEALPDIIHFFKDHGYTFGVVTPMTPQPW